MVAQVEVLFFICATINFKGLDNILHRAVVELELGRNLALVHAQNLVGVNNV